MGSRHPAVIQVVGLHGGVAYGPAAQQALAEADVVVGAKRLQESLDADPTPAVNKTAERIVMAGPLDVVIDDVERRADGGSKVVVLASGDPGFFGIVRLLAERFGKRLEVLPAPSSVSLAFARAGINWDDAAVVSCHGRPLELALPHLLATDKAAVLVSPTTPPEAVGKALVDAGATFTRAVVCSHLGSSDEVVVDTDLDGLAQGQFDPVSVVILEQPKPSPGLNSVVAWHRAESPAQSEPRSQGHPQPRNQAEFEHRASMITKPEVRSVVLAQLELAGAARLWDVGAASGSIGISAAAQMRSLSVVAIERYAEDCDRIRRNQDTHGVVNLSIVEGTAPACFDQAVEAGQGPPDRIFVGGGGIEVVWAALDSLADGGIVVATFAVMATALAAHAALGAGASMVQMQINRAIEIGADQAMRLEADNPVFIVRGTSS